MAIKIKTADIIKFILIYSIITNFMTFTFGFPSVLSYFNDLMVMVLLVNIFRTIASGIKMPVPRVVILAIGAFLIATLCSYILNLYSPLMFFWGVRNNFRAIVYFVACCMFLEKKDVTVVCNMFLALMPVNVVLCTIQYFQAINSTDAIVLKFFTDYIGGIFGNQRSCNRMMNVYLAFIFAWVLAQLLQKKCSVKKAVWVFICCVYISLISDLKIVVLEFAAIIALTIWWVRRKANRVVILLLTLIAVATAFSILHAINPTALGIFENLDVLIAYTTESSYGENSLNRLTVIPYIQERIFNGDILKTLFGVGLGNADYSNFAFLTSSNYLQYGYLKYHYFMSGQLFYETGFVGLTTYLLMFVVLCVRYAKKLTKRLDANPLEYAGTVFSVVAILCVFYNTSLRSEVSCYMAFFFMAIPIIWDNRRDEPEDSYLEAKRRRLVIHW